MKLFTKLCLFLALGLLVTGCTVGNGRICGPQTPIAYCDREAYERLVHPKAYGEYWVKPGVTKEVWRQDWVDCGGMRDGAYSSGALSGSTNAVLHAASEKKTGELSTCMQSKGYVFQRS